jgi:hypothetical protein
MPRPYHAAIARGNASLPARLSAVGAGFKPALTATLESISICDEEPRNQIVELDARRTKLRVVLTVLEAGREHLVSHDADDLIELRPGKFYGLGIAQ